MSQPNTLKLFLKGLEQEPEPAQKLAENITPVQPPVEDELTQLVALIDDRVGIKLAELNKTAVGVVGPTPDPQAITPTPLEVPKVLGPAQQATNATVAQIIDQITNGGVAQGPNGYIASSGQIIAPATARGPEQPIVADAQLQANMAPTKIAEENVVALVYNTYFGGNE